MARGMGRWFRCRPSRAPRVACVVDAGGGPRGSCGIVLAAASALAHVEVRYGADGFSVRTGWNTNAAVAQTASVAAPSVPSDAKKNRSVVRRRRTAPSRSRDRVAQTDCAAACSRRLAGHTGESRVRHRGPRACSRSARAERIAPAARARHSNRAGVARRRRAAHGGSRPHPAGAWQDRCDDDGRCRHPSRACELHHYVHPATEIGQVQS